MVCAKKGRIVIGAFVTENTLTKSEKIVNNNYFILTRAGNHGVAKEQRWITVLACPPLAEVSRSDGGG
jgi:hypothetical protein